MFKPGTVIVLGAAVSNEVGLPLGAGLKTKIAGILPSEGSGDDYVRGALFNDGGLDANVPAVRGILSALPRAASIDNLIEHRGLDPAFKHCAKVGIVASILQGERQSRLFSKSGNLAAEDTTYADLFRIIVGNASVAALPDALSRVSFINFNYDRCLEHYLFDWLKGYSGLAASEASRLVGNLTVVRPYGTVGPLPQSESEGVHFGQDLGRVDLNALAANILTFSEERKSGVDTAVRSIMREARQLIFLGCAYHPQNMKLLTPDYIPFEETYGTCYAPPPADDHSRPSLEGFAGPMIEAFQGTIYRWPAPDGYQGGRRVRFEALTSRQLVAKYAAEWIAA